MGSRDRLVSVLALLFFAAVIWLAVELVSRWPPGSCTPPGARATVLAGIAHVRREVRMLGTTGYVTRTVEVAQVTEVAVGRKEITGTKPEVIREACVVVAVNLPAAGERPAGHVRVLVYREDGMQGDPREVSPDEFTPAAGHVINSRPSKSERQPEPPAK